ncbi:ComEC/Rec2 family competence protein [Frankia sp. AgB32]|uniref:ComEC/Rec2 family competence protein n=1 Tax=Frankia sp. AgB32 TaxID=631119 RepID=UPI00200E704F|nr:ComEC/Rec2 family competence protein [Frankia sp. AgB32]MCK9895570.1 ComEC/Rec2 family competence protein [Frankia sp. AgB32]
MEIGLALPERPEPAAAVVDARLVVPALAAWAGAAVSVSWTMPGAAMVLAGGVTIAVPALLVVWSRVVVRTRGRAVRSAPSDAEGGPGGLAEADGDRLPAVIAVLATSAAFLAAGLLSGGLATRPGHHGLLADLARGGAAGTMSVVLTDDPRPVVGDSSGPRAEPSFVVAARLESATVRGVTVRTRVPVVLLGRGAGWNGLLPSQHLAVSGRLATPRSDPTVAAVVLVSGAPAPVGRPSAVQRIAGRLRTGLRAAAGGLPQPRRGLLPALVVGDLSNLDADLRTDFRRAGMTHLTAVSGGNVAIVTAAAVLVAAWARRGLRLRGAVGAGALLAFVVLARPSPSVLRAGVMGLVGLAAVTAGRPRAVLPALAASVTLLVLAMPTLALSVGFALSVQATAGMIILAPGWHTALARRLPERVAEVLAVAAAAQIACTPLIAWIGGGVSLVAIPANILAAPAVPAATVLGVLALAAAVPAPPLAHVLAQVAGLPCWWLVAVAHRGASLPAANLHWPGGTVGAVTAAAVAVAVVAMVRRRWGRRVAAAALAGLLMARCVVVDRIIGWPPPDWRVVACDVGQGDALVLRTGPGSGVLVDAGPDPHLLQRCLHELGVRRLPVIILSHLHADHVDGLPGVLGRMPVGEVLIGPLREPIGQWRLVRRWTEQAGVPLRAAEVGSGGRVGESCWSVLAPRTTLHGTDSDPNNDSLVLAARVGGVRILLTGDVEAVAQRLLLELPGVSAELRADVLKVPHHGSANQEPRFLAATGARYALISVGAGNDYGHPAASTLRALARAGAAVARTDRDGALAVVGPGGANAAGPAIGGCSPPGADPGSGPSAPGRATVTVVRQRAADGS